MVQGACEGGMRGQYKARKSPEAYSERPYRDFSSAIRPHLRRAGWLEVWCPLPGNQTPQDPIFETLCEQKELGPI